NEQLGAPEAMDITCTVISNSLIINVLESYDGQYQRPVCVVARSLAKTPRHAVQRRAWLFRHVRSGHNLATKPCVLPGGVPPMLGSLLLAPQATSVSANRDPGQGVLARIAHRLSSRPIMRLRAFRGFRRGNAPPH